MFRLIETVDMGKEEGCGGCVADKRATLYRPYTLWPKRLGVHLRYTKAAGSEK